MKQNSKAPFQNSKATGQNSKMPFQNSKATEQNSKIPFQNSKATEQNSKAAEDYIQPPVTHRKEIKGKKLLRGVLSLSLSLYGNAGCSGFWC
ncbi:MAG TPA: hypothetical protein VF411_12125 [Bacteroidia bacterium]